MVAIVQDRPVSKDITSLQKSWGLCYVRRFIIGWAVLICALKTLPRNADSVTGMQIATLHALASSRHFAGLLCWHCQT